jgi:predicted RND superfamily exporter protein
MTRGLSIGRSRAAGTLVLIAGLLAMVALGLARFEVNTGVNSTLPAGDPVTEAMAEKDDDFGGDPIVVILESERPREMLTDQQELFRLVALEGELAKLPDVAVVYGPGTVLNQTAGAAQDMLAQISGRRYGLRHEAIVKAWQQGRSEQQAMAAGDRAVAEFDRRYGSLLVRGLPAGLPTLHNPQFVETVMFTSDLKARPEWRFVVPDDDKVALLVRPRGGLDQDAAVRLTDNVERAVAESDLRITETTVTGVPAITAALSDRATTEAPRLGALSLGVVGLVFLLVPWTARRRSRLRPTFCALLGTAATLACFGWLERPVSLGVVAFLPIVLGIGSDFPLYLSRPGQDRKALVAAAAAVVGFASLGLSPLPFVSELGTALALGIVLTVASALAMRRTLGPVPPPGENAAGPRHPPVVRTRPFRALVATIGVAAAIGGWLLLPGLDVESQPEQLAAGLPELNDAKYAESVLGSTGEISVVVSGPDVATPEALVWSRNTQTRIVRELGDRVHPVLSTADLFRFLGRRPSQAQVDAAMELMPSYLTSAVVRGDRQVGVMVLGVEFDDVAELGDLVGRLEDAAGDPPSSLEVEVVGLPVAAARGLDLVSDGRLLINLIGIALSVLVVALGLRDVRQGVHTLVVVLLASGWVGLLATVTTGSLNPLTVGIGALITATGCEFSVMLSARNEGRPLETVLTAAIAGTAGYLVLAASELAVLRDFGILLAGGVVCSMAAALLVRAVLPPASRPERASVVQDVAHGAPAQSAPATARLIEEAPA